MILKYEQFQMKIIADKFPTILTATYYLNAIYLNAIFAQMFGWARASTTLQ